MQIFKCFILACVFCFNTTYAASVSEFTGVYKVQLKASSNWKQRGRSDANIENILEIVPFESDKIYVRIKAENPINGKVCGIWGIATGSAHGFTYTLKDDNITNELVIAQNPTQTTLRWKDLSTGMGLHCGNLDFPNKNRQEIRYKDKILSSREYKMATEEFRTQSCGSEPNATIAALKSCEAAMNKYRECAVGASLDLGLSSAVRTVCTAEYKLSAADAKMLDALIQRCSEKYKDQQGTLFLSMQASCELDVVRLFWELSKPVEFEG